MCCFSGIVTSVSKTRIFARLVEPNRQALVYQMGLNAPEDVAMILPIPVPAGAGEDAVKFIDLSDYGDFFADLAKGFPFLISRKDKNPKAANDGLLALEIHSVGSFEASFVPTVKDFARLDARFRLPDGTWDKLPAYAEYGFAVFKLKKGNQKIHPMAFSFPTALARKSQLFFPTVHIHDGKVHAKEEFDHQLYAQTWPKAGLSSRHGWEESAALAGSFTQLAEAKGLLWKDGHIYRKEISGVQPNEDTVAQAIAIG